MRKRRERFQVFHEILSLCQKPKSKTYIMHKCNLNFSHLQKFLKTLSSNGLLKSFDGKNGKVYQITHDGCRFVTTYEELRKLISNKIGYSKRAPDMRAR